jgi:hypothetical protein
MVEGVGRLQLSHKAVRRPRRAKQARTEVTRQAELARDRARTRLWEMRRRYKLKVAGNEAEMDRRRLEHVKGLNPTARLETIAKRKWAERIRNPANWSSVPLKPKYSRVDPKPRIYGKRFEVWEKKIGRSGSGQMSKEYQEAAQKMAESVAELRKDIAGRAKELAAEIGESTGE